MDPTSSEAAIAAEPPLLPAEVEQFFREGPPRTLTVRGAPGTGKTSFALSNLVAFEGRRIYVSSSVPREALYRQFAWLAREGDPKIEFLELLRFQSAAKEAEFSVGRMREALQARASDLVDIASVLSLPSTLYHLLESDPAAPKMVVIDSWEGWVENLLGGTSADLDVWTTRWVLERALLEQIQRTGAHVLMVVERDERNRFDYVVDGAVSLSAAEFEGRQERWIALTKLRGLRIANPSYPFTLEGAKFRCIAPMTSRLSPRPIRDDPDPAPTPASLWPGSTAFAVRFGRLPPRGTLLLETDGETPLSVSWLLVAPMILASLRARGRVVLRPPAGFPIGELWEVMSASVPAEVVTAGLRLVDVVVGPDRARVPAELVLSSTEAPGSTESVRRGAAIDFLRRGATVTEPNLAVVFPHTEFDPGSDASVVDPYLGLPSAARRAGALLGAVLILRSDDPHIGAARVRSAVHLVARARRGQFFLYGIRPWTPLFVIRVAPGTGAEPPLYDLIPVV